MLAEIYYALNQHQNAHKIEPMEIAYLDNAKSENHLVFHNKPPLGKKCFVMVPEEVFEYDLARHEAKLLRKKSL